MYTDAGLRSSAEGSMLLEFHRRGQRVFCTVSHWRLQDLERAQPFFRQDYFLGNIA